MSVRAKFTLNSYETSLNRGLKRTPREDGKTRQWGNNDDMETVECRTLKLSAVADGSEENKKFFHATPQGNISIGVLNPDAWEQFELGKSYYVDFTPASD